MLKTITAKALALSVGTLFAGCAFNHFHAPDGTSNKGKKVTASLGHFNPLYLFPATNLDKLVDDLSEQCGDGKVEGITTTVTNRYFYVFGVMNTYELAGRCSE